MVGVLGNTFEINGVVFRRINDQTVTGQVFRTIEDCYNYAHGIYTISSGECEQKVLPKKNQAIPPKKRDLKF